MRTPSVQLLWGLFLSTITALAVACPICLHAAVDPPVSAVVQVGLSPSLSSVGGLQFQLIHDSGALYDTAAARIECSPNSICAANSMDNITTIVGWVNSSGITAGANQLVQISFSITNGTYPRFAIDPSSIIMVDPIGTLLPSTTANFMVSTAYQTSSGAVQYLLNSIKEGTGNGTVTSTPAGLACTGACTAPFNAGTQMTLMPTASADSYFAGWSGSGCSGTGNCVVTMTRETTVSATFYSLPPVKLGGSYFPLIRDAYASAVDGDIIRIKAVTLAENIVFDKPINITLTGGENGAFSGITGYTTVSGSVSIKAGTVTAENMIIM